MKNTDNTLAATQLTQVQLQEVIEQLKKDDSILMQAYCEYSAANGYESVYDNDEDSINMMFENAHDALRATFYGDYNPAHAYLTFDGSGNLQSFEYLDSDSSPIDVSELAQWLISEDKLADYDITVTTLDDMLASIEDNITDDENALYKLCDYLSISYNDSSDIKNLIGDCMYKLEGTIADNMQDIYKRLINAIYHLNINYQ